jgi:hypothetical protein
VHHVVEGVEAAEARGADDVGAFGEAGGLGEPFGDGGPAVRDLPAELLAMASPSCSERS